MKRFIPRLIRIPDTGLDAVDAEGLPYNDPSARTFLHNGDIGDIVYALPTIQKLGGGHLVLSRTSKYHVRDPLNAAKCANLTSLLLLQSCVKSVRFEEHFVPTYDLNRFRHYLLAEPEHMDRGARRANLAEAHLLAFGFAPSDCQTPWLRVDAPQPVSGSPILIHRSARWRNTKFPWPKVLEMCGGSAAFVGFESEHRDFTASFGDLPYIPTSNLLDLARLIAGCYLFIGNQSAPYALATALNVPTLLEVCLEVPNCHFNRREAYYCDGETFVAPACLLNASAVNLKPR